MKTGKRQNTVTPTAAHSGAAVGHPRKALKGQATPEQLAVKLAEVRQMREALAPEQPAAQPAPEVCPTCGAVKHAPIDRSAAAKRAWITIRAKRAEREAAQAATVAEARAAEAANLAKATPAKAILRKRPKVAVA